MFPIFYSSNFIRTQSHFSKKKKEISFLSASPLIFSPPGPVSDSYSSSVTHIANGLVMGLQSLWWKGGFVCTHAPRSSPRQCQLRETHFVDLPATRHLLPDSLSLPYKSLRKETAGLILAGRHVAPVWLADLTLHRAITLLKCDPLCCLLWSKCTLTLSGRCVFFCFFFMGQICTASSCVTCSSQSAAP